MYERSLRIFARISYIRAFWLGSMISILFLKYVGLDDVEISLFHTITGVAIFCLELPTGVLADRYGYRASIIASFGFLALAFMSFLVALAYGEYVIFFGTAAFFSLSSSFYSGAANAYVYRLLDHVGRKGEYLAYQSAIASRSRIIEAAAIMIGAALYAQAVYLPYLLQAVFISGAFALTFGLAPEPRSAERPAVSRLTAGAFRRFAGNRLYPLSLIFLVIALLPFQYFHHVVNQSVFEESGMSVYGIGLAGMAVYLASGWLLRWVPALHARLGDTGALLSALAAIGVAGVGFLADGSIYAVTIWSVFIYA
jgi:MFS family permease